MRVQAFIVLIHLLPLASLAQQGGKGPFQPPPVAGTIMDKLLAYNKIYKPEQVYLHFDKPYYAAGDTIYFKAYVVIGMRHQLSQLSKVLHVELMDAKNAICQSILLRINDGIAWGDFALPASLLKGNYRVRAYTNWMRNREALLFMKSLPIGSSANADKIAESGDIQAPVGKSDLQFFPEGGSLISGINTKIAFKAVSPAGSGIDVKGVILDGDGNTVAQFASSHLGMGYFNLKAQAGKIYKASVTFADGTQNMVELPPVADKGITMAVNNDSLQKTTVSIITNDTWYNQNKGKSYDLLIYSGGGATMVNCKLDSPSIKIDIIKKRLFTGVASVTLFSSEGAPLSERLFFVQNYNQLNLSVKSTKNIYAPREKAVIIINLKNRADSAAMGHLSVSVTDETKVPVDEDAETTILTNMLLTNDLKGDIEQPNYYFTNITGEKLKDLDLVMLTHGYRRFEWNEVLNRNTLSLSYQPENALSINGLAQTPDNKPVAKSEVSLMDFSSGFMSTTITDEKGHFEFANLDFSDSTHFILQAADKKGKNETKIIYQAANIPTPEAPKYTSPDVHKEMAVYLNYNKKLLDDYAKYGPPTGIVLKEVKVQDKRVKANEYRSSVYGGAGHADQVFHMDDLPAITGKTSDVLAGRLAGVVIVGGHARYGSPSSFGGSFMLIVVDGTPMDGDFSMNFLNPHDIETVEVLKFSSAAIYGVRGAAGVLVFNTRQGKTTNASDVEAAGVLPLVPKGFYAPRVFYAPKYDNAPSGMKRKDLRTTIFWAPEVATDADGNATVDYYNADTPGTYRVVIEGLDEKGNIGRQVYHYEIK